MMMFFGVACLILAIWGVALASAVIPRLLFLIFGPKKPNKPLT